MLWSDFQQEDVHKSSRQESSKFRSLKSTYSKSQKPKANKKAKFTFGLVNDKFVWLNHDRRLIQYFDLKNLLSPTVRSEFFDCLIVP